MVSELTVEMLQVLDCEAGGINSLRNDHLLHVDRGTFFKFNGVDLLEEINFGKDERVKVLGIALNSISDLAEDILASVVLLSYSDDYPVVQHVEDLVGVKMDLVKEKYGPCLQGVKPHVEVGPLDFKEPHLGR